jgi:uncharacterized protein DUF1801
MNDPIEDFFARYAPEVQAISRSLRAIVRSAMPQANEILYANQNHVGYSTSQSSRDRVVYICPMKDYVRLGFMRGTQIPDPDHKLVGEGKWLRHVKVRNLAEAAQPALRELTEAAWAYTEVEMKRKMP